MTDQIWINANGKISGPGSVEQFLTALEANRIANSFQFSTTGTEPWYSIVSFSPAAPAAAQSSDWYLTKFGSLSNSQHGPYVGSDLVEQRLNGRIDGDSLVLHQLYTGNQWREFSTCLLQFSYNAAYLHRQQEDELLANQRQQEKEEKRRQKEEEKQLRAKEHREALERKRRENEAREAEIASQHAEAQHRVTATSFVASDMAQAVPSQQHTQRPPPLISSCWHCNMQLQQDDTQCVYCRVIQ